MHISSLQLPPSNVQQELHNSCSSWRSHYVLLCQRKFHLHFLPAPRMIRSEAGESPSDDQRLLSREHLTEHLCGGSISSFRWMGWGCGDSLKKSLYPGLGATCYHSSFRQLCWGHLSCICHPFVWCASSCC